ncbi:hypothetical protein V2E39_14830 [Chryseobacterium arthrosphaerae]|uniref:Uncharacterized protein n=1 Tax=Chryseobacterium arthrosphaerae TaxID=651561 RepID=A0A1B8Z9Q6_9FLAO|nr:hypothetical protein [Chryseobacterium arthrosphaerae]AYZ10547.1 hypothetical protein EGY05_00625 [Chryseobacterium arthrosphaerae]MDG4652080.1 hypothetical protein [Chryseobacterium arthrosphaerae]OCA68322.1 hypothetical protein BBI00_22280 [Chryseobacterium arthrosphaerae]WES97066.1 hypothetical protein P2W68_19780 [Chryseobacterium arthrosphaerae]
MDKIKFSPLGKRTFLISFLAGTFLWILFLITQSDFLVMIGFYYVLTAIIVNVIILLQELIIFITNVSEEKASGNSVVLLLANIPIALVYLFIILN